MPLTITHAGGTFTALGFDKRTGRPIWPVDEILSRRKVGREVESRLRRMNPDGVVEGECPRGWNMRNRPSWRSMKAKGWDRAMYRSLWK